MSSSIDVAFSEPADKSALVFARTEYISRLKRLSATLEKRGVDVYMGSTPENLNYFTGFDPLGLYFFQHIFYRPGADQPSLLTHKAEMDLARTQCWIDDIRIWRHGDSPLQMAIDNIKELGLPSGGRLGLELGNWYLTAATYRDLVQALPNIEIIDVTDDVQRLRAVKSPAEIAFMREAARFSDIGFAALVQSLKPGVSEAKLLGDVQSAMGLAGSEYPTLPFIIGSGARSGLFHAVPTSRVIEDGDPVMAEITGSWKRYNSNIVRTIIAGRASEGLKGLWRIVNESFWRPFELIKPGTAVGDIDLLSRQIRQDFKKYIVARAGFGMGLAYPPAWASRPNILVGEDDVLEAGMIFSLEPSIAQYHGVSMIFGYNILVTDSGAEILQRTDKTLFEVVN
jgi:Xaa-Pro aminopeptidase